MASKDIIADVAKYKRGWRGGLPETPCGYGSKLDQTQIQRQWIPEMVAKYDIRSINDIGAGDLNWIQEVKWPHPVEYQAFDLVPRHADVKPLDLIHEIPPYADLAMCLWLLNHLPVEQARRAQDNLILSGADYVLVTWWKEMDSYLDLEPIEEVKIRTRHLPDRKLDFYLRLVKC